jgi:Glycosyltransferase 61
MPFSRLRKIARNVRARLGLDRSAVPVDYLDAPIMDAVSAEIPAGAANLCVPSYVSRREDEDIREVALGRIELCGDNGWIFQHGIWLMAFSWYGGQSFLSPSFVVPVVRPARRRASAPPIEGRSVSTLGDFPQVYGHVLLDELPKLLYLLESASLRDYDTIICSPLASHLLSRVGHPRMAELRGRIRTLDRDLRYCCDDFIALQRAGCRMNPSRKEIELLRRYGLNAKAEMEDFPPSMFIERGSQTRAIENFDSVKETLDRFGIVICSPNRFKNPWRAFAAARLIVGVSGSDLSDSVFMSPAATLVEIHPSDHIKPYNWNVTRKIGVAYQSLVAQSKVQRNSIAGPGGSPVVVDPKALQAILERTIAGSTDSRAATVASGSAGRDARRLQTEPLQMRADSRSTVHRSTSSSANNKKP